MKKLVLLMFLLGAGSTAQAQIDWSEMVMRHSDLYSLATDVGKKTDKVVVSDGVISLIRESGTVSFQKERDKTVPIIEHYKYFLLTSTGRKIPLDKMNTEKVIEKFQSVLLRVKESLKQDNTKEVESILNTL